MSEAYKDLIWDVRRSVRYHSRRRGFFQGCHTVVMALVVLAGSATITAFGSNLAENWPTWVKLIPTVTITVLGVLDVVIGFSAKASLYTDLMRRFIDVERELMNIGQHPADEDIARLRNEVLHIERDEPPVLRVLDTLCHNELARAMGYGQEHQISVGWAQRLLAHFFDLGEAHLMAGTEKAKAQA